jgi:hypothetical protein
MIHERRSKGSIASVKAISPETIFANARFVAKAIFASYIPGTMRRDKK